MSVELPRYDKRTAVIGSTGSGKTQFAVWLLSSRDFHIRPWMIFDFKGDDLISQLGAIEIKITDKPPTKPGLYLVRPLPGDDELVSDFLRKCWAQEHIGIYIDEGYMVPKLDRWFRACLTQGRSKEIEMIILSQRPVWMDKFVFTEANYFAVFNMNSEDDRKTVSKFLGKEKPNLLPKYHCLWYDVDRQQSALFKPVPDREAIIQVFKSRLMPQKPKVI